MPSAMIASSPRRRRARAMSGGGANGRVMLKRSLPGFGLYDAVSQEADALDLELDHVAALQEGAQLEPAAAAHGARADEVAGKQRLGPRNVGNGLLEAPVHVAGRAAGPLGSVHPRRHRERVRVGQLVGGDEPRSDRVSGVEVLAL